MPRYSSRTGLLQEYQPGPFDSTHAYVQWGGKLPGNEEWSCGFRLWKQGGVSVAEAASCLVSVSAAIAAFHVKQNVTISNAAKLSYVKCNAIALNGKYQAESTNEATFADLSGGGQAVPPNQIALAVSLTTGFNRGVAHRGRFFLPMPWITLDGAGRLGAPVAASIGAECEQLLQDVNNNPANLEMVVMSRKAGNPGHRRVTGIEIGRVLDTQRRRRRSLVEDWQ